MKEIINKIAEKYKIDDHIVMAIIAEFMLYQITSDLTGNDNDKESDA